MADTSPAITNPSLLESLNEYASDIHHCDDLIAKTELQLTELKAAREVAITKYTNWASENCPHVEYTQEHDPFVTGKFRPRIRYLCGLCGTYFTNLLEHHIQLSNNTPTSPSLVDTQK